MRGRLWIFVPAMALLALVTPSAWCWNGPRHIVVDLVAYNRTGEDFRREAVQLLRQHLRLGQHFLGKDAPERLEGQRCPEEPVDLRPGQHLARSGAKPIGRRDGGHL